MRYVQAIALVLTVFISVLVQANAVSAHWDLDSRFWRENPEDEKFLLRIHNGTHANQRPVERLLRICFWVERVDGENYTPVSEKMCFAGAIKPDEWKTHGFELKDLVVYEEAKQAGKLLTGRYRAVAVAREQRNRWVKIFLGAALLRHYSDFVVK
jgi:type II secretory pathway component PulL